MMKSLIVFFEIPATQFERAVTFYKCILEVEMTVMNGENEKMAFFPAEEGKCPGAISWTSEIEFRPSDQGIFISLNCQNIDQTFRMIEENGGKTLVPKTKIEAEKRGYFGIFLDCEGSRIGLHSES
ncbi:MAG: VOC family protein [Tannerellaceae bacterium]|nr:VOC family protein [Tannerellaceae bacterium]